MTDGIEVGDDGGIVTVRLARPERRNALTSSMIVGLREAMAAAGADPAVRAVVLTGADPAFCAGLDLHELSGTGANMAAADLGRPWPRLPVPVVAAVNGPAMTGGLELVLHCDVVVASDRAVFADTHLRLGLLPGWGLSALLPRLVGVARAKEMSATGLRVPADLALTWGLVNRVVPHDSLMASARATAEAVSGSDRAALAEMLRLYDENAGGPLEDALAREAAVFRRWTDGRGRPDPAAAEGLLGRVR